MRLLPIGENAGTGALLPQTDEPPIGALREAARYIEKEKQRLAYIATLVFSALLYLRPHEIYPSIFGILPLAKIVAIVSISAYLIARLRTGEQITIWPIELKLILFIFFLGVLFMPMAASPGMSFDKLNDPFSKVVMIFFLMINLIDSRKRLRQLISVVVLCGVPLGLAAIKSFFNGEFTLKGLRIVGLGEGLFGNPNDLAICLNMLLPLTIVLGLTSRKVTRLIFLGSSFVMAAGIMCTYSRGGFLGLIFSLLFMLWKLSRRKRIRTMILVFVSVAILLPVLPGSYGKRVLTIFDSDSDTTGSSNDRKELLIAGINLAMNHPIIGVGVGNFPIYSIHDLVAHNSYVEIAAELGVFGLLAYLLVILLPFRSLGRLEKDVGRELFELDTGPQLLGQTPRPGLWRPGGGPNDGHDSKDHEAAINAREFYFLIVGVRATLIAYLVVSFFGSIEYLWYLYYPVAYAISLGIIHSLEKYGTSEEPAKNARLMQIGNEKGSFGNNDSKRGVYWLKKAAGEKK
jgi:O-antigen ligase